jgi:hypothetical protein
MSETVMLQQKAIAPASQSNFAGVCRRVSQDYSSPRGMRPQPNPWSLTKLIPSEGTAVCEGLWAPARLIRHPKELRKYPGRPVPPAR